ncbi:hypothetical protein RYH80_07760 [Halobaculum sp. MBLA0147]|uniref:hypothetical protein n=1 Tax=Halobaculum sp. MBLA0147 TaxID=3079934 RepID=UPI003524EC3E
MIATLPATHLHGVATHAVSPAVVVLLVVTAVTTAVGLLLAHRVGRLDPERRWAT